MKEKTINMSRRNFYKQNKKNSGKEYIEKETDNIYNTGNNNIKINEDITKKWLTHKGLNCRYTTSITLFYFLFNDYIGKLKGAINNDLKILNEFTLDLININKCNE